MQPILLPVVLSSLSLRDLFSFWFCLSIKKNCIVNKHTIFGATFNKGLNNKKKKHNVEIEDEMRHLRR